MEVRECRLDKSWRVCDKRTAVVIEQVSSGSFTVKANNCGQAPQYVNVDARGPPGSPNIAEVKGLPS